MSETLTTDETTDLIQARMDQQRAQIHKQFTPQPGPSRVADPMTSEASADAAPPAHAAAMKPFEPRSFLMRILMGNPQLLQRIAMVGATTLVGARYSSWALKIAGVVMAARRRA